MKQGDGMTDACAKLQLQSGVSVSSTFLFHAFDFGPCKEVNATLKSLARLLKLDDSVETCELVRDSLLELYKAHNPVRGGVLDHIYVWGGSVKECVLEVDTGRPEDKKLPCVQTLDKEEVRKYVLGCLQRHGTPFTSDHQRVCAKLQV